MDDRAPELVIPEILTDEGFDALDALDAPVAASDIEAVDQALAALALAEEAIEGVDYVTGLAPPGRGGVAGVNGAAWIAGAVSAAGARPARRGVLAWLGDRPYVALALFAHVVLFAGFYQIVTERPAKRSPEVIIPIEIELAEADNPVPDDAKRAADGGGAATPAPIPDAPPDEPSQVAQDTPPPTPAASAPDATRNPTPSDQGKPPVVSRPRSSPSLNQLIDPNSQGRGNSSNSGGGGTSPAAFGNRSGPGRAAGLSRYGGNAQTEDAVRAALAWLDNHQHRETVTDRTGRQIELGWWRPGAFSRDARDRPGGCACGNGDNNHGARTTYTIGATALAVLAFLGHGNTATKGDYAETVRRAINFLLSVQRRPRYGKDGQENLYNRALVTLALGEAYVLSRDRRLKAPLQRAAKFLVTAQNRQGGWDYDRYSPRERNDTSITSWTLMALKTAAGAGVSVPRTTFLKVIHHFKRMTRADGWVWYAEHAPHKFQMGATMLASGLLSRELLGEPKNSPMLAIERQQLARFLPHERALGSLDQNYSTWYAGTFAMFFAGGDAWNLWNTAMRPTLLALQETHGHMRGAWPGRDRWSWAGGRIYATAINALTLEAYYRYVPEFIAASAKSFTPYWDDDRLYRVLDPTLRGARPAGATGYGKPLPERIAPTMPGAGGR